MKPARLASLTAVAMAMPAIIFAQDLPARKVLTMSLAQDIAREALAKCRADGYKVTVRVVDADNLVKVVLRDDGAILNSVQLAQAKASSAVLSPFLVGRGGGNPNVGVPIRVDNQTIGAVGVSGAPDSAKDHACANAALAKVADQLK
jgi:uncharacterized protein GlcG (DUF336 family)